MKVGDTESHSERGPLRDDIRKLGFNCLVVLEEIFKTFSYGLLCSLIVSILVGWPSLVIILKDDHTKTIRVKFVLNLLIGIRY